MEASDKRIANQLYNSIDSEFNRVGLLFRVFYRVKSKESLTKKLNNTPGKYSENGKKIQDLFGFRVTLYYPDDLKVAQSIVSTMFEKIDQTVDEINNSIFDATRCNFIYKLPSDLTEESATLNCEPKVDNTFEVQFRTVLSEGWHEVEHDDLGRALNGILPTLETSDWGMSKLFEDLSYRHYKSSNWEAMVRTKFRLRLSGSLNAKLLELCSANQNGKKLYRINRKELLDKVSKSNLKIPMNLNNVVYLSNYLFLKSQEILDVTPIPLLNMFEENFS
ncbi:hypothetical protein A9Q98_14425 [Thalassotalea sp. 42_200_T64]|nr:hypothetical protein A9Q98_14425 [Thalassotalea sp. 42_200_T64]